MLAVIKTGGKQYLVSPGQKIKVEKLEAKDGAEVVFDKVLLLDSNPPVTLLSSKAGRAPKQKPRTRTSSVRGKEIEIGTPFVEGAKVIGKTIKQGKGKKIVVFKYKAKKRYHRKKGHRQAFTEVEITKIVSGI